MSRTRTDFRPRPRSAPRRLIDAANGATDGSARDAALADPQRAAALRERAARRAVNSLLGFCGHAIVYLLTCFFLLVVAGFYPAMIVALAWGIGLGSHGFFGVVAPALRARLLEHALSDDEPEAEAEVPSLARAAGGDGSHARSLEELSAAIAHEIRNPITAAKSLVQQIAEDPSAADTREHARVAIDELDRVERSIGHLLRFAREEPFEPRELALSPLIASAVELVRARADKGGVRISQELDPDLHLTADPEQLRKVLANLLGNALDAHAAAPRADAMLQISAGRNLAGSEVWIRVRDNGPGISPAAHSKLFRPFHTTKPQGTGLGLALARKVMEQHAGRIEAVPRTQGAEFLLTLPREPPSAEARA